MSTAFYLNPKNRDPERARSLQQYLILHAQQEQLRRRRSSRSGSSSSSESHSPSPAPSARSSRRNSPTYTSSLRPPPSAALSPSPIAPIQEEDESSEEEDKLYDINQQIKTVLTTLLNCESVKSDSTFRSWVSKRLMDAEKDMKQQRRRQGAPDPDLAAAVRQRFA